MVSKFVDWRNTVLSLRELRMGSTKITATPDEINQVCDGVGPTATASNITALTDVKDDLLAAASGGGSGAEQYVDVQLDNDAIKALPTTRPVLLPPPGTGLRYAEVHWQMVIDTRAGAYTNVGGYIYISVDADGSRNSNLDSDVNGDVKTAFSLAALRSLAPGPVPGPYISAGAVGDGDALTFHLDNVNNSNDYTDAGNFTGGHADNTLSLRIWYALIPTAPFGA